MEDFTNLKFVEEPDDDYQGEETPTVGFEVAKEPDKLEQREDVKLTFDEFLKDAFADTLAGINKGADIEQRIKEFIKAIDFLQDEILVQYLIMPAFLLATKSDKIDFDTVMDYDAIIFGLKNIYLFEPDDVRSILRSLFFEWMEKHPVFKERYSNISILDLIRFFSENYR